MLLVEFGGRSYIQSDAEIKKITKARGLWLAVKEQPWQLSGVAAHSGAGRPHGQRSLGKATPWDMKCCSVPPSCPALCDPMDYSTPGFPVLHYLPEIVQTHAH